ncbi:transposase-like protein [Paraburkholderia sp. 40]
MSAVQRPLQRTASFRRSARRECVQRPQPAIALHEFAAHGARLPPGRRAASLPDWPLHHADSTGGCNTLEAAQAVGVLQMKQRRRIYYTETQKALMRERWQKGESLQRIAQLFDRNHSSAQGILAETGGIRPPQRRRSRLALTLAEREEISRALVSGDSVQSIAKQLARAPSTATFSSAGPKRELRVSIFTCDSCVT